MAIEKDLGWAATGVGTGAAFGGPVGAAVGGGVGLLGSLTGLLGGDDDKAKKALLEKQRQLAAEAQRRREQLQRSHMRALTQQTMAFAPRNNVMAGMFGPDAAFTGKQIADMTANPMGPPEHADPRMQKLYEQGLLDQPYEKQLKMMGDAGIRLDGPEANQARLKEAQVHAEKVRAYQAEEAARRAQIEAAFGTPQGPAPIAPTRAAPARRY